MKLLTWLKKEWLQILILAVPYGAAALLWDRLPEQLPNHWNFHGEVDGYAGKVFGTLFLPTVGVVCGRAWPICGPPPAQPARGAASAAASSSVSGRWSPNGPEIDETFINATSPDRYGP